MGEKVVATNRKAHFEYFLLDHFEAGLALQGSEIKSIRAGQMSLQEAYIRIDENSLEAWLAVCAEALVLEVGEHGTRLAHLYICWEGQLHSLPFDGEAVGPGADVRD